MKRGVGILVLIMAGCAGPAGTSESRQPDTPSPAARVVPVTTPSHTPAPMFPSPTLSASEGTWEADVVLEPAFHVEGEGSDVDSIAFWEAPDPSESLMFVTAKGNQLVEVWRYPFSAQSDQQPALVHSTFGSSQVNGVVVDQEADRLYVAVGEPRSTVAVFALPSLEFLGDFIDGSVPLGSEPNLALLTHPAGLRLYVSADDVVYILDATSGSTVGQFAPSAGLETLAADDRDRVLYIPDENEMTGVYAYTADGDPYQRNGATRFATENFDADAEGIAVYRCTSSGADDGRGFIVVSDQRSDSTEFEVFDRETWRHLGIVRLEGVANTDGIATTQVSSPAYPMGLFVAVHDDESVAGIGWDRLLDATGLGC